MAHAPLPADAPDFARRFVNLADAALGAVALSCSDDFFADRSRMLDPGPAVFVPDKYDTHGKWMDGWESRRKRGPGHDWCIVRLARPGVIEGFDLDTSHFTGNFPPAASIEGCVGADEPGAKAEWSTLLPPSALQGNRHHFLAATRVQRVTHLRVNLFPDGGLARLRAYGRPDFDGDDVDAQGRVDLAAALQGATVVAANNEHFGPAARLLLPGRGRDMGDGWETRRRREPGHDWCIVALARPGVIEAVEVDTAHFKGNFPDRCSMHAAFAPGMATEALVPQSMFWTLLLPECPLRADHVHRFEAELSHREPVTHVRFNIHPDGGVSRLRLLGRVV